jgi:hypothetical protein
MVTLVDFTTHVKGIEYILSLLAIVGFLILWEVLKPKPFKTIVEAGKDDISHIEQTGGPGTVLKSIGKIIVAPFIGLAYIIILPIGFLGALVVGLFGLAVKGIAGLMGKNAAFTWRPMEAYLSGKKNKKSVNSTGKKDNMA